MSGPELFIMVFGAVLAIIGVILFSVFTWFKRVVGGRNTIKVLNAEFVLSHPALVIFVIGSIMVVLPIVVDRASDNGGPQDAPTLTSTQQVRRGPREGDIAFRRDLSSTCKDSELISPTLYIVSQDTKDLAILSDTSSFGADPAWSPDGKRIAFTSRREAGVKDIYTMNSDGSLVRLITPKDGLDDLEPTWSPDGTRIAFTSKRDGNKEIYVMSAGGSGVQRLTMEEAGDFHPDWSPDGSRIAFASERDGNREIYVMNIDGSGLTNLTDHKASDDQPVWSPDGSRIAFVSRRDGDREIYVMSIGDPGVTNLTEHTGNDFHPDWSPDGTRIAFASERDVNREIYIMNSDGSGQHRLTDNPTCDDLPIWWTTEGTTGSAGPTAP